MHSVIGWSFVENLARRSHRSTCPRRPPELSGQRELPQRVAVGAAASAASPRDQIGHTVTRLNRHESEFDPRFPFEGEYHG